MGVLPVDLVRRNGGWVEEKKGMSLDAFGTLREIKWVVK